MDADLTQQEAADLAGVDVGHWSRAERGLVGFSIANRVRIARRLGCRVADIFEVETVRPVDAEPAEVEGTP